MCVPHVSKLRFLSKSQKAKYNELTKYQFEELPTFARNFINKHIDVKLPKLIKMADDRVVFEFKGSIFKIIFRPSYLYQRELYYTNLFYDTKILTKASSDGCVMKLPKYGSHMLEMNVGKERQIARRSLILQVAMFHSNFMVHHDIKPTNIVKKNQHKWKIIDFGLAEYHAPDAEVDLCAFHKGTRGFNVPNYKCDKIKDKLFWIYMKDWYGISTTLNSIGINCNLYFLIENMEKERVLRRIRHLLERYIDILPFYCETIQTNKDEYKTL